MRRVDAKLFAALSRTGESSSVRRSDFNAERENAEPRSAAITLACHTPGLSLCHHPLPTSFHFPNRRPIYTPSRPIYLLLSFLPFPPLSAATPPLSSPEHFIQPKYDN